MREKDIRRARHSNLEAAANKLVRYASLAGGVLGLIISLFIGYRNSRTSELQSRREAMEAEIRLRESREGLETLRKVRAEAAAAVRDINAAQQRIAELEARLRTLPAIAAQGSPGERQLASLRAEIVAAQTVASKSTAISQAVESRMARIEAVILQDPQKALSLPLLQRDLAGLDGKLSREVEVLRAENGRMYDLMKWLVGLMALVSLSLIGTAVGNVFKREKDATDTTRSEKRKSEAETNEGSEATP